MTIRRNLGLLIILASIGVTLIGFLFSTYDAKRNVLDNVMRSNVIVIYADCKGGGNFGCLESVPGTGLSIPYRWIFAIGFVGVLAGIYLSTTARQNKTQAVGDFGSSRGSYVSRK